MAKLLNGILGRSTGKIGNIVSANWRGINYARTLVIPANPRTTDQTDNRNAFAEIVLLGRAVFTDYISTYWNGLARGKKFTGWSKFMGTNRRLSGAPIDRSLIRLTTGDLEGVANLSADVDTSTNIITFEFEETVSSSGSPSDSVSAKVYVPSRNYVYSNAVAILREDLSVSVTVPALSDVSTAHAYIQVMRADGTKWSTTQTLIIEP